MTNPIQQAHDVGQAIWLDYIRRGSLTSGELQRYIDLGVSGVTSNPTIFEKAISGSTDYDETLLNLSQNDSSANEMYEVIVLEDIRMTADLLRSIYDDTGGAHGYVSLEVSPLLAYDAHATVAEARRLFAALDRPNVMIKVPATPEGIPAVRRLTGEGVNVNATLIFSLDSYRRVREAYIAGLEDLVGSGRDPSRVASVASFFLSRVDTAVDGMLAERVRQGQEALKGLLGKAAIANARLAYYAFRETFGGDRFAALAASGARVQRPLWASTGTKNPAYSGLLYVEPLIGPDTVNTMPPATISAFLDHGRAEATLEQGVPEAEQTLAALAEAGISMESVTTKLLADGVKAFVDSYEKLLAGIAGKKTRLLAREHVHPGVGLGRQLGGVEATLADLGQGDVVGRIWRKDYTVWKPEPIEIADRLGWLTITDQMHEQVADLAGFAAEVRKAGFRHVVLLGMGGSSLGPEVLRRTFANVAGHPELIVLDSVVPASVRAVTDSIDVAHTLFLVSSKSGTTIEPVLLMEYFKGLVDTAIGKARSRQNFVAITDPGTPLARLAEEEGFRRVFLNPPDMGGRYSVLSYFGLVPAVLMGVDTGELLERADCMREACASCVSVHENPGAWLGATMGSLALSGRDKLTLVTSPSVDSLGLWVEQLIAESTGKDGKGIVPVAGEPFVGAPSYGNDRLFVYVRLDGDDNSATDRLLRNVRNAGQPVMVLEMRDKYDLGAEFFQWQFATAVAGALLGINPFDQPDVQTAKDAAERVLQGYMASARLPEVEVPESLADVLSLAGQGRYLAIMAYVHQTPRADQEVARFRRKMVERYRMATTFGYGPRFLHSTGQLHKGGPDTGLFLQITAGHEKDVAMPGRPYTFGVVTDAQAIGDLQALQAEGRCVTRIHVREGERAAVKELARQAV